jgi:hypothetical protein
MSGIYDLQVTAPICPAVNCQSNGTPWFIGLMHMHNIYFTDDNNVKPLLVVWAVSPPPQIDILIQFFIHIAVDI